jgi:putative restriction endonuclease
LKGSPGPYSRAGRPPIRPAGAGAQPIFAAARVTEIRPDPTQADHFYAFVSDYVAFTRAVPFRDGHRYYERQLRRDDRRTNKGAFGRAMRTLSDGEFEEILAAGLARILAPEGPADVAMPPGRPFGLAEDVAPFARPIVERLVARPLRDAAFAVAVKEAYADTCAVTGLRLINGGGRSEVQVAHIRPVAAAGPDSPRNGMALSATVHWMFDRGLISVADEHTILVAEPHVPESALRLIRPDRRLTVPDRPDLRPHPGFLDWHRRSVFKG